MRDKNHQVRVTGMCNLLGADCRGLEKVCLNSKGREAIPTFTLTARDLFSRFLGNLDLDRLLNCTKYQTILRFIYICQDVRITMELSTEQAHG